MSTDGVPGLIIRVIPLSRDESPVATNSGPPLITWSEYNAFRNAVISVLRSHGTVGLMGEMPDLRNESPESERNFGANGPDFSVLNEMWNEWNRWIQVETSPWLVNAGVLTELVFMEQRFPGWSVYLALQSGGLTFFGDRILYEGDVFLGSQTIDDLGNRCQSTKPA